MRLTLGHRCRCLAIALAACDNMANQPKRLPYELPYGAEANWPALPPPDDRRARRDAGADAAAGHMALLERGQQRFDIYCAPCHGRVGDGNGMIVQRGFPRRPPITSSGCARRRTSISTM